MRLVDAQRRLRERGRIRLGYSTPAKKKGGKVPHRLDAFRFTTPDEVAARQLAELYGGTVEAWQEGSRNEWDVRSTATRLPVVFLTSVSLSQSYQLHDRGYLVRLCDGDRVLVPGRGLRMDEKPCLCDPDERECTLTTHLSLILPELPGIGTWTLMTGGRHAAHELAAVAEVIEAALGSSLHAVPATLSVVQHESRRLVDGKPMTLRYPVPVLDIDESVAALGVGRGQAAALPAGERWRPVPVVEAAGEVQPAPSVAEQLEAVERPKPRKKSAPPLIPPTGVTPRAAGDVDGDVCERCGRLYGTEPLVKNPEPTGSRWVHAACLRDDDTDVARPDDARDGSGSPGPATGRGRPSSPQRSGAEPAAPIPATAGDRPMSHGQHAKLMALQREAFPKREGMSAGEADTWQRAQVLAVAAACGQPGLSSRDEITAGTAGAVIDVLQGIRAGHLALDDGRLVDANGDPVTWSVDNEDGDR